MPAERAGYTVTMFLVDVSPSMGKAREVEVRASDGSTRFAEMTNLEWSLQFVKLKIQEMIFTGRKTDQCGVILFGSEETNNLVNEKSKDGGYEHVSEYVPIGQPNASTLAKLSDVRPGPVAADPIDALIVGIETQAVYLGNKKTWTRKIVLVTDGEGPMEIEDWETTVHKMNQLAISLTVVGVDFDDEEFPFKEEDKSEIKATNEAFYYELTAALDNGVTGTCAFALQETARPDIKQTKSTLMGSVLRLGDVETRANEAVEILVKYSKCTALARPKSWKRFGNAGLNGTKIVTSDKDKSARGNAMTVDGESQARVKSEDEDRKEVHWRQLRMRTEYYLSKEEVNEENVKPEDGAPKTPEESELVDEDQLVRGFKYGSTYVPCPEGQFPKMSTVTGIDICGFFYGKKFRREQAMGEVYYVWADPGAAQQQIAMSSIVQAMYEKNVMAIARWVSKDDGDPKMGVLSPCVFENVDCFLWAQMPFADDVRKYTFASLDTLLNKDGHEVKAHAYLPTNEQMSAMDEFVDAMDLMEAGDKDEEGARQPWFDTRMSYNPTIHRIKQALFHGAIVQDLDNNPVPPPHPELMHYFNPPRKMLKRGRDAIDACIEQMKVKQVPRKMARVRKDEHVLARDDEEEMLLLDRAAIKVKYESQYQSQLLKRDDDEEDEDILLKPHTQNDVKHEESQAPDIKVDRGRAPGRIIGSTYPLEDFKINTARGNLVTKAVEDLAWVIQDIVTKPFASRRHKEMIECLQVLRATSLKEDEIDSWNTSLRELKFSCLNSPGNPAFWDEVKKLGPKGNLIADPEARQYSGTSDVSEEDAEEFLL